MKSWWVGMGLCLAFAMMLPALEVRADSDSGGGSEAGVDVRPHDGNGFGVPELDRAAAGSAIVLLLGGVAYLASRRRKNEAA